MKELILAILIACSLSLTGCTEEQQSTGNKQLDDALGIKTEEKSEANNKEIKKKDKAESKTTDDKKETKTKKNNDKSETAEPDPQSEEELIKRVSNRDIVLGQCDNCNRTIRRSEVGLDRTDRFLCKDCYNEGYCKCLNCGKIINGYDEGIVNGSSGSLCSEECADQFTSDYCSKCGVEVEIGNSQSCTYDDNGNLLCLDCYFEDNDQVGDMPE